MIRTAPFELQYQPKDLLQALHHSDYQRLGIDVDILRLDKIDPEISGNKWFKLKLNLADAVHLNRMPVISFGGAFSNHIHALSAAGKRFGFDTVGVIRGEPEYAENPTLSDASKNGMKLHFVDRKTYRQKETPDFVDQLFDRFGLGTVIPEGGANTLGVKGCETIADLIELDTQRKHHIVMAVATGTTFAGVLNGLNRQVQKDQEHNRTQKRFKLHGIAVLKAPAITQDIRYWLERLNPSGLKLDQSCLEFDRDCSESPWVIHNDFHFGGYAQIKAPLVTCMDKAKVELGLPLDPIYTAKMLFGFEQLIRNGEIQQGDRVTLVHTGGLQGVRGCQTRLDTLSSTLYR